MERMTKEELKKELEKLKDFKVYAFEGDVYVKAEDYKKIAIENKKLRAYADNLDSENDNQAIEIEELKKENKKLKKYYDRDKEELMESCYGLAKENDELKKENENLNEKVRFLEECLDRKEKLNEKYRKELKELKETLEHRDGVLSIMYDLLRSDLSDYEQLCMIDVVIDVEVGNEPQNKLREELLDRFWKRDF